MLRRTCCLLLLVGAPWLAAAEVATFDSAGRRVALLELYTSEGCSSCPRADRWLSGLTADDRLWKRVVPVAFHVDYWDYIGWRDRFASPVFTARQRTYQRQGHIGTVYTPGLVVNGEEWRSWFVLPALRLADDPDPGRLRVTVDGDLVEAGFEPAPGLAADGLELHVAMLGFGIETAVRAGENQGRKLRHDFVVLGYRRTAMPPRGSTHVARVALPPTAEVTRRRGIAAWLSRGDDQRPLQAVGGWLD